MNNISSRDYGNRRIQVVDQETGEPLKNIKVYHLITYQSSRGPVDLYMEERYVIGGEYWTNENGIINLRNIHLEVKDPLRWEKFYGEEFIINLETDKRAQLENIYINGKKSFDNLLLQQGNLSITEFRTFELSNNDYYGINFNGIKGSKYNRELERETNEKYGFNKGEMYRLYSFDYKIYYNSDFYVFSLERR